MISIKFLAAKRLFTGSDFEDNKEIHFRGEIQELRFHRSGAKPPDLIMPGIIDSHVHMLGTGLAMLELQLNNCHSLADFQACVRDYIAQFPGTWITGRGWDQNKLGFTPDRALLDQLCPQRPLIIYRVCGHVLAANSAALAKAGICAISSDVAGGVIQRDEHGTPTGIFEERAMELFENSIPLPNKELNNRALTAVFQYAHMHGITGAQTDDLGLVGDYGQLWQLYDEAVKQNPLRVQLHHRVRSNQDLKEFAYIKAQRPDTDYVRTGAAKLFLDGSLGARTAALLDNYSDQPGHRGVLIYEDEELQEIVALAEQSGITLALHAIGDRAIEQALNTVAAVRGGDLNNQISHRLIHCQITNDQQIRRLVQQGMIIEFQPGFLQTDMDWAGSRVGSERLQFSYCWQTMIKAGLTLAGGSDAPVEDLNPWLGIATAVNRSDKDGNPARGWRQNEALSLAQTLRAYTLESGALMGDDVGRIEQGYAADLAVFDVFNLDNLKDNRPDRVIIGGETVYQR